jgi:hypothetical protein
MQITQIWCGDNQPISLPDANVIVLPASEHPTITTDYKRFELAAESDIFIYADFDIEPQPDFFEYFENFMKLKLPKRIIRPDSRRRTARPDSGFVCFGFYEDCPEASLFAHIGRQDFFRALLAYKQMKNIPDCRAWTYKVLRHFKNAVTRIPDQIYKHRHDTMLSA